MVIRFLKPASGFIFGALSMKPGQVLVKICTLLQVILQYLSFTFFRSALLLLWSSWRFKKSSYNLFKNVVHCRWSISTAESLESSFPSSSCSSSSSLLSSLSLFVDLFLLLFCVLVLASQENYIFYCRLVHAELSISYSKNGHLEIVHGVGS